MNVRDGLIASGLAVLLLSGCSAASGGSGSVAEHTGVNAARSAPAPHAKRAVISADEVAAASQVNAYELVQALRPAWLRMRGQSSINRPEGVMAYRDGMPIGPVGALRQIPREEIARVVYYDPMTATQRWGTGHGNGAIEVITGRR